LLEPASIAFARLVAFRAGQKQAVTSDDLFASADEQIADLTHGWVPEFGAGSLRKFDGGIFGGQCL
jgi:hypothetical protein